MENVTISRTEGDVAVGTDVEADAVSTVQVPASDVQLLASRLAKVTKLYTSMMEVRVANLIKARGYLEAFDEMISEGMATDPETGEPWFLGGDDPLRVKILTSISGLRAEVEQWIREGEAACVEVASCLEIPEGEI